MANKLPRPQRRCPAAGRRVRERYDLVVVGGGLSGVCAAIAGARHGLKTALIHDRPVLGGNSSSEIRVNAGGANNLNAWARETGIIEEMVLEDRARNHEYARNGAVNSVWDMVLYEWVRKEETLTLHLNTVVNQVEKAGGRIAAVVGVQDGSERTIRAQGRFFVDATGDGTVGALAGAEFRFGREARREFNEPLAPVRADLKTQGSSLMFRARDVGKPTRFTRPTWAEDYSAKDALPGRGTGPFNGKEYAGYWWIEVGVPYDTIDQNEEIKKEALRHLMGVWDRIKNHGDHGADNMALDWIGQVPGKRESRRLVGDYLLTQNDVLDNVPFDDRVAYGGWWVDIHTMGGILAKDQPPVPADGNTSTNETALVRTYSIPFRSLYSRNVTNLLMAGRDISVTHCALGTTRLMLTCAAMGQAVGTAAFVAKKHRTTPAGVAKKHARELQQTLLKDDAFILDMPSQDPLDLARGARASADSSAALSLPPAGQALPLAGNDRAQIVPVSADHIGTLALRLTSVLKKTATVEIAVAPAADIWTFRAPGDNAAKARAAVPANSSGWVDFALNMPVPKPGLYQVTLPRAEGLSASLAKPEPGVAAGWKNPKFSRWNGGSKHAFAMRLDPATKPFEPANVANGVARPEAWPNIWISDPALPLPQSLCLTWDEEQQFDTVYLAFDTFLNHDPAALPPLWKAPECVKDYRLEARVRGRWKRLAERAGNYQRRAVHRFPKVRARQLRLKVLATNGGPSARVYEIRVYKEGRK